MNRKYDLWGTGSSYKQAKNTEWPLKISYLIECLILLFCFLLNKNYKVKIWFVNNTILNFDCASKFFVNNMKTGLNELQVLFSSRIR